MISSGVTPFEGGVLTVPELLRQHAHVVVARSLGIAVEDTVGERGAPFRALEIVVARHRDHERVGSGTRR